MVKKRMLAVSLTGSLLDLISGLVSQRKRTPQVLMYCFRYLKSSELTPNFVNHAFTLMLES